MIKCKCGSTHSGEVAKAVKCDCGRWNVVTLQASAPVERNEKAEAEAEYISWKLLVPVVSTSLTPSDVIGEINTNLADDPQAIESAAQKYSTESMRIMGSLGYEAAIRYANRRGVDPVFASTTTQEGREKRLCCPNWWRLQIRKTHWQEAESTARELGQVSYKAGRYASFPAAKRRTTQNRENMEKLASTNLIGPDGTPVPLLEISQHNVTDKTIRRHETLARIRGLDEYERKRGADVQFWTITTPSKYHPTLSTGKPNPKYGANGNPSYTAKEANDYLLALFAKLRVVLHQQEIQITGMRIAEPHHDGTPHHHYIVYVQPEHSDFVWDLMARYARKEDESELTTQKLLEVRAKCIEIDERGVVGYAIKYVCKNLDGGTESDLPAPDAEEMSGIEAARRVDAWASHHRIRQFAFFGGKTKIMIWRALRGVAVLPEDAPADIVAAHVSARAGDFETFITASDGMALATGETGDLSYYDSLQIEKPFAIVNRFGQFMNLVQHKWKIVVNSALRKAFAKTDDWARHYVSKWDHIDDILIPF